MKRRRRVDVRLASAVLVAAGVLVGVLVPALSHSQKRDSAVGLTASVGPCTSTVVDDVLAGTAGVTVGYLPPGFSLQEGNPSNIGPGQYGSPVYYGKHTKGNPWPSTLEVESDPGSRRLGPIQGNSFKGTPVAINGHRGLLVVGDPLPQSNSVWWDATSQTELGVTGFLVPTPQLLKVALSIAFHPQTVMALPRAPGRIVSRSEAIAAAARDGEVAIGAKLSSYTEVSTLLGSSARFLARGLHAGPIRHSERGRGGQTQETPTGLAAAPWTPVWAVLLAPSGSPNRGVDAATSVALVIAASGKVAMRLSAGPHPEWFNWLTDRDPALHGCQGGTTARLPFGILTRTEESYVAPPGQLRARRARTLVVEYKLASERAIYASGSDELGGCIQYCSLNADVWLVMRETKADPGTTVICAPPTGPRGYRGQRVKEYTWVSYSEGGGLTCTGPPPWFVKLKDLAPPAA